MKINMNRRGLLVGGAALGGTLALPAFGAGAAPGGFAPDGLKRLISVLKPFVDQAEAVGLLTMVYRRGEVAQVEALGWQDREAKIPMARDTIFRVMSMTKPMVSVATLMLVEEGKLKLTDAVTRWLPELGDMKALRTINGPLEDTVPASRPMTVLDLLTHRSGLAYAFTTTGPLAKLLHDKDLDSKTINFTPDQWIKTLSSLPLAMDVGLQWQYGLSFDVLGVLIERISQMPFQEFMRTRIFAPLGMTDTAFFVPKDKAGRVAVVYGYGPDGKRVVAPKPLRTSAPSFASGGGGAYSTADDYLKFARMLMGLGKLGDTRLLSRKSVQLMTTNWLTPEQRKVPFAGMEFWGGQGFGLGVAVVDDIARNSVLSPASKGSFYWPGAYGTWWVVDPAEDMILLYMVQNDASLSNRTPEQTAALREKQAQTSLMAFQNAAYRAIDV